MPTRQMISDIEQVLLDAFKKEEFLKNLNSIFASVLKEQLAIVIKPYEERLNTLELQLSEMQKECDKMKKEFEQKLDSQEQYSRRNNIRIFGVAEVEKENIEDTILKVFNVDMKLNINPSHIDRCHRVGFKQGDNPRAIIVKFTSYKYKQLLYQNKRLLKGSKLIIKEDLTKVRVKEYRKATEMYGKNNVWTRDGLLYMKSSKGISKLM